MSEPTMLTDPADVPLTMSRREYEAALKDAEERGRNGAYAEMRRKMPKKIELSARIDKLERLVGTALEILIPGLHGAARGAEKDEDNNE